MQNGRIAVFMPTANCKKWLRAAIDSIVHQTYPYVDLYVIDDGSDDVDHNLVQQFTTVNFLRLPACRGPFYINNMMLALTDSEFVSFQDADDTSYARRFETQLSLLERLNLDGCGTWSIQVDGNGEPIGFDALPELVTPASLKIHLYNLTHPTTLFHRHVFSTIGAFDATTKLGADTEFLFRVVNHFNIGNVQQFLYRVTKHPASLTQNSETGFSSAVRKKYSDDLWQMITAIWEGKRTMPAPGYLLSGEHAALKEEPEFELIHLAENNTTWSNNC